MRTSANCRNQSRYQHCDNTQNVISRFQTTKRDFFGASLCRKRHLSPTAAAAAAAPSPPLPHFLHRFLPYPRPISQHRREGNFPLGTVVRMFPMCHPYGEGAGGCNVTHQHHCLIRLHYGIRWGDTDTFARSCSVASMSHCREVKYKNQIE